VGTQLTVQELISDISKKQLLLPEFQRGYVWKSDKVRGYLDSLYRGYPTGSFLIWKTPNPGITKGQTTSPDATSFQLILDGQQRLTSIYALVTGSAPPFYEGETLFFNLHFNVKTETFKYYSKQEMQGKPEWVPVTRFFQRGLGEYLKAGGDLPPEDVTYLMSFFDRLVQLDKIKTYTYYLDVLTEKDMEGAVNIFNLVNTQGTTLSKSDLALSNICTKIPGMRKTMLDTAERLKRNEFDFGLEFLTRCLSCVATFSGQYEPLYGISSQEILSAWQRAESVIDYLLNVLQFDAFIDSARQLPSSFPLVPLVVYLANGKGSFQDEREKKAFIHWFYAAEMWGRYSGSTETKLTEDLESLKAADPPEKLRSNLLAERGRIRLEAVDLESRTVLSPFFFMSYVVARAADARDWFNGLPLYNKLIGKSNGLEHHHIFPSSMLYKTGPYDSAIPRDRSRVNEVANIAFLTKAANLKISDTDPLAYLAQIQDEHPGYLASQSVPVNDELWRLTRYEDFLAARRHRLASAINAYLDSLLVDPGTKTLGIEDYIAKGESSEVEFKGSLRWDYRLGNVNKALEKTIARTLAGFMNAKGGTLLVGVADDGNILGLDSDFATLHRRDADGWEQALRNVLNTFLSKDLAAFVDVSFAEVGGKLVAIIHADGSLKPVYFDDGGTAVFYVRAGNTTQQLDVKEAHDYIDHHFYQIA
jgi:hypothetical protein